MSRISVKKLAELQEATGKEIEIYAIGRNIFELQFGYYNKLDNKDQKKVLDILGKYIWDIEEDCYESDDGDEYPGGPPIILRKWSYIIKRKC